MKTQIKLLALIIMASIFSLLNNVSAQGCFSGLIFGPNHTEVQSANPILDFTLYPSTPCSTFAGGDLTGVGINQSNPQFMLDILCDPNATTPTNGDVNVTTPIYTGATSYAVGYRIGGTMMLWHAGDPSSIYCGNQSGSGAISPIGISFANTVVGANAGSHLYTSTDGAQGNCAFGYYALNMTGGTTSTYPEGSNNVAIGGGSLEFNTSGSYNTSVGAMAEEANSTGGNNVSVGESALGDNSSGWCNTAIGFQALFFNMRDSNTAVGDSALIYAEYGNGNAALGYGAGIDDAVNPSVAYDNTFLGSLTDAIPPTIGAQINGATAIGTKAVVAATNQIEVGNNNNTITMGLSGFVPSSPLTRLELNTKNGIAPFGIGPRDLSPVMPSPATGWSGLRFDDLTAASIPSANPGIGVLSVNSSGDVVYVIDNSKDLGFLPCTPGPIPALASPSGLDLNNQNLYFVGNAYGRPLANDVFMGYNCGDPTATGYDQKLSVLQNSGTTNSIGLYVENRDLSSTIYGYGTPTPLIGIESFIPSSSTCDAYNVAGWFEAKDGSGCHGHHYAIFVPNGGGTVDIGFPFATDAPSYMLKVNGTGANIGSTFVASDSTIKSNVVPIENALAIISKLQGVSYNYITNIIADSGMTGTHYGFIAQQVERVLPSAIKSIPNPLGATPLKAVSYNDIIPWLVEGMKQEDQRTDSLVNVIGYLQSCINTLCPNGYAPVRKTGGGGNSGDSNTTITNVQEVLLSANLNAPFLYQNKPNPFTKSTIINYYIPPGTQGATMVFYDTYGDQLKTVELSQTGNGTLNITPDNLGAGIYSYSLVVNGNVIDTKRMILQK